jgi:hypothetical protein
MAANLDSSTEALMLDNARYVQQSKDISAQLRELTGNPVRKKLLELGVKDEQAFYAWLEKQASPMDWAQAEREADDQLTSLLAVPGSTPSRSASTPTGRSRRMRSMV